MFVEALQRGEKCGQFRSGGVKPDVTTTPIPRYDLLERGAYDSMSVQFSRGCPFQCEFCDIIVLYGRKPRTKEPSQLIAELQCLYDLGWKGGVFMVDDNFIGNKRNVKRMLLELQMWQRERGYPFRFDTEASLDLADDQEMIDLMLSCNFAAVFMGIETPDTDSLAVTKKIPEHPLTTTGFGGQGDPLRPARDRRLHHWLRWRESWRGSADRGLLGRDGHPHHHVFDGAGAAPYRPVATPR